jgi:hypothetical protein
MPDDANHPADTPRRPRMARYPRRAGRKQTVQATRSPTPEQEADAPVVSNTTGVTAPQSSPVPEASTQPSPNETSIGEHWGEFPPGERQAELRKRMEAWEQEQDHGDCPGPFTRFRLTGADIYWRH